MNNQQKIKTHSALKFILYFARGQKYIFAMQGILCFAWSAKEALFPYFIKLILNGVSTNGGNWSQLFYFLYGLVALWVIMEIAMRTQGMLSVRAFPMFRANIRQYCFEYCQSQTYSSFLKRPVGEYIDHITHLPQSCQTVLEILLLHFISIGGALAISFLLLFQVNSIFFILLFAWLCCHLSLTRIMNSRLSESGIIHADAVVTLSGQINDAFNNFLSIKWFGRKKYEFTRFSTEQDQEVNKASHAQSMVEKMRIYQSVLAVVYMLAMTTTMATFWHNQSISIGDLTLIPMLSFSVLGMIWWLTQELNTLYRELNRIRSSLSFFEKIDDDLRNKTLHHFDTNKITINCDNLSFKYDDKTIFDSINLKISAHSHLGVSGFSGSGKSTFLKILTGILPPNKGNIFINQINISKIARETFSRLVAVVPQDPVLFNRSIFENIHYGNLSATRKQVLQVAKQSLCHEFIEQLPLCYNTIIGDGGVTLSVGQRQRLIIARALLADVPVIIFDEPTSSLDSITEKELLNVLKKMLEHKTVIIISHRVSTLSIANRIIVFDKGKLVEDGDFNTLYKNKGKFHEFVLQQTLDTSSFVNE